MYFKKLIKLYERDNDGSSMYKYEHIINKLMGNYIVDRIDVTTMKLILIKLDYLQHETGYAVATEKLLANAEIMRGKKLNLKQHYHFTSSSLFKAIKGERVSIEFALDFCNVNNMEFSEYFKVVSIKKYYSIASKGNIKNCLMRLFNYGIEHGICKTNPLPKKYIFRIDEYKSSYYLPDSILKDFIKQIFKHKNINGRNVLLIYLLIGLDYELLKKVQVRHLDFKRNEIRISGRTYKMSNFISNVLKDYYYNDPLDSKVLEATTRTYCKTLIYRIKDEAKCNMVSIDRLNANYDRFVELLNGYVSEEITTDKQFKAMGLDSPIKYNDFKEFLRLKKEYEGTV